MARNDGVRIVEAVVSIIRAGIMVAAGTVAAIGCTLPCVVWCLLTND
jgi:hypothetical protein